MKKSALHITVVLLLILNFVVTSNVLANPIDIEKLNNYDFDVSDDSTLSTTSAPFSILTFAIYLVFFVIIAALAYLTTRWIGKHQNKIRLKSKYMEVVDSLYISGDNALHIVKSPEGFLLVGTGKDGVALLGKLGDEEAELIEQAEENPIEENFPAQLNNYLGKIKWFTEHNKSGGSK